MPADVRSIALPLRVVWLAVCAGAALAVAVFGALAVARPGPLAEHAEGAFYGVALVSVVATAGAFALLRSMEGRIARARSDAEAERAVRWFGVAALAAAEVPALAGPLAAFLTGDVLSLAFAGTFFAFAWLTWPSDGRVAGWLALRPVRPLRGGMG